MNDCSNIKRLVADLETTDRLTRERRARRRSRIRGPIEPECGIYGGVIAQESVREARQAYIDGLYMATILLSLAFVEHEVTSRVRLLEVLDGGGETLKERPEIRDILKAAKKRGVLTPEELSAFADLQRIRNSYSHFRSYEERHSCPEKEGEYKPQSHVTEEMEPNARRALEIVESFMGRNWLEEVGRR